jgi:tetratricopeptide (TPR) repeat protein
MPTYREYLLKSKHAYDNNQLVNALSYLDSIEQDFSFTDVQKLEACKLRTGIIVKQKRQAKSPKKKRAFEIALLEAFMLQDWYALLTSPEPITHYQPNLSEQMMTTGERFYNDGKPAEALNAYQAALALNPLLWKAAQQCMTIYFKARKYEEMTPFCKKVIADIPQDTPINKNICFLAHYYLGTAYLAEKKLEPAMDHYLKAADIDPESIDIMLKFGEISKMQMYAHHQYYTLGTTSVVNTDNPELTRLSTVFATESLHCFNAALDASPKNLEAHQALAEIYFYRQNMGNAKKHYTSLLQSDGINTFFYKCKIAQISIENKNYITALSFLSELLSMPNFNTFPPVHQSNLYLTYGFIHEKLHHYDEAMNQYAQALKYDIRNLAACFASDRLVRSRLATAKAHPFTQHIPDPKKALPIFASIINSPNCYPTSKAYLIGLCGHVYAKLKNIELALMCYKWAATISPSGPIELAAIKQLSKLNDMRSNLAKLTLFEGKAQEPALTEEPNQALNP